MNSVDKRMMCQNRKGHCGSSRSVVFIFSPCYSGVRLVTSGNRLNKCTIMEPGKGGNKIHAFNVTVFCYSIFPTVSPGFFRLSKVIIQIHVMIQRTVTVVFSADGFYMRCRAFRILYNLFSPNPLPEGRHSIRSKRDKRLFCQLVYERLLADTGELCSLNNIRRMLEVLGLYRFLEQELDHGNWRTKVRSLNMMSVFRLKVDAWLTNALLLSKSQTVRRLAVHASIMSGGDAKLDYFESDRFDRLCCIKDEIELGYSLQRRRSAGQKLPDLARLALLHDEVDAQCIFVKLMRYFGQSEHCSQLVDLFRDSKDHRLAMEIASTWGYLKYTDGEELLQEALLTRSDDVQVSFMQALTRMDTGRSVDALAGVFATAASSVTSYEALRCLYNYGQAGRCKFDELKAAARDTAKEVLFAPFEKASMAPFIAMDKALDYAPAEATVYNVHE